MRFGRVWLIGSVFLVGLGLGIAASSARAQEITRQLVGAFYTHNRIATFEMPIEVTTSGEPRTAVRLTEEREHYAVPEYFGNLIDITAHGDQTVFWYLDGDGVVRNAILDGADRALFEVARERVHKLRFEVAR